MDFIDFDEQDFSSFQKGFPISPDIPAYSLLSSSTSASASSESVNSINSVNSLHSLHSSHSAHSVQTTAVFIRSASVEAEHPLNPPPTAATIRSEFSIALKNSNSPPVPARLQFNPKGPHQEGRDSQVFQGSLLCAGSTRSVAVKVYRDDRDNLQNALKEIEIATSCTSGRPDFLEFFFSGPLALDGDGPVFVSIWEWIEFGSLDRAINASSVSTVSSASNSSGSGSGKINFNNKDIFQVIQSIAQSLNFLHSRHIAHHDLKPQNILISSLDRVVLVDFGDSKQLQGPADTLPIDEGIGLGTLAYTAPELLSRKSPDYSPFSADVYSFGVLLFYLLNSGKILPFATLIPHRAVQLILTAQKGFFAGEYNPESPAQSPLFPLMKKCLQVDPQKRPTFPQIIKEIAESSDACLLFNKNNFP